MARPRVFKIRAAPAHVPPVTTALKAQSCRRRSRAALGEPTLCSAPRPVRRVSNVLAVALRPRAGAPHASNVRAESTRLSRASQAAGTVPSAPAALKGLLRPRPVLLVRSAARSAARVVRPAKEVLSRVRQIKRLARPVREGFTALQEPPRPYLATWARTGTVQLSHRKQTALLVLRAMHVQWPPRYPWGATQVRARVRAHRSAARVQQVLISRLLCRRAVSRVLRVQRVGRVRSQQQRADQARTPHLLALQCA
mmetsp:Transcript_16051/g.27361  ORF Transcript_16051/g.27361 Transcript_16051/m.27361 type:complete len:254 (-) Transcript_16051:5622-6383(-)